MSAYLKLLVRRPAYRRLWAADAISLVGDWFSLVAVSVLSLSTPGGGVIALATSLAAHLLPQSFAAPFGGWFADRFDKRRVLIAGALLEGALTLGMVVCASEAQIVAMQLLLCLRSMVSAAREPATGAALPELVEQSELRDANGLGAFTWSLAFAFGMSLGGLATSLGPVTALVVDAGTFGLAAALLAGLPALRPHSHASNARAALAPLRDIARAISAARQPVLRRSVFGQTPVALAAGAAWIHLNLAGHAFPIAASAATTVGLLQAVRGGATAIGPLAMRFAGPSSSTSDRVADVSAIAIAAASVLFASVPSLLVATAASILWGAGAGALWLCTTTEIQERAPQAMRGRMIALSGLGFTTTMSIGAWLTAAALANDLPAWWVAAPVALVAVLGWFAVRAPGAAPIPGALTPALGDASGEV